MTADTGPALSFKAYPLNQIARSERTDMNIAQAKETKAQPAPQTKAAQRKLDSRSSAHWTRLLAVGSDRAGIDRVAVLSAN